MGGYFAKYSEPNKPDSSKVTAKNITDLSVSISENLLANSNTAATPVALSTAPFAILSSPI